MQLISLFLFVAIPSLLVRGWTIPKGHPDGVYIVTADESGNEVHTPITLPPNANSAIIDLGANQPTIRSAKFRKRQIGGFTEQCGGYALDPTSTNNAFDSLQRLSIINEAVPPQSDWYALSGSTVAYVCNFSNNLLPVYYVDLGTWFQQYISTYCGSFRSSWALQPSTGQNNWLFQAGYKYPDTDFCFGRGLGYDNSCGAT